MNSKWSFKAIQKYRHSLSGKLILSVLIVSSFVTLFTSAIQIGFDYKQEVGEIEQNLLLVKKSHLDAISGSLWNYDLEHLKTQLIGVLSLPGIRYIEVKDVSGNQVVLQGEKGSDRSLTANYPLLHLTPDGENTLGSVEVGASLDDVHHKIFKKIYLIFFTQFLKTIIVSTLVYFTINQILIRHLLQIAKHVKSLNFHHQTPDLVLPRHHAARTEDELDVLVHSVNSMQESLFQSFREVQNFNLQLEEKVKLNTAVIIEQRGKLEHTAKMSALGEMAGGMAHEINTPLAIIQLRTDQLLDHAQNENMDKAFLLKSLENINSTIKRISKIINGLRSFARDGRSDSLIEYSALKIIEDTFSLCREHLSSSGIQLELVAESDIEIKCRPIELSQVLLNLLNNARDAIQDQSEKWIRVELKRKATSAEISVTDSGHGIAKEIQEKMMQPFFTTKEIGKGTGLGLSISKGIIDAHGGKIEIDNLSPNTKFIISLPLSE